MQTPKPSHLRIWTEPMTTDARRDGSLPARAGLLGPHRPFEFAELLYAREALGIEAPHTHLQWEPYSLAWFEQVERCRHRRHGKWIPSLLEFSKHAGETFLALGGGLGTDWVQYAKKGASVVVCSPSAAQLALVRRNFGLRGLTGRFLHAQATHLPLDSGSIDVACASGLFEEFAEPQAVADEVYRVLKPGGKVLAVLPARFDVHFWVAACLPWTRWLGQSKLAKNDRRYSARTVRRLFTRFVEHRIHKRCILRKEVPHLWRWLPRPLLERALGHYLILKAFKPLSAAMPVRVVA